MRASLIRTGSVPLQNSVLPASPRVSLTRRASFAGDMNHVQSPRLSMHSRRDALPNGINRESSELTGENFGVCRNMNRTGSRSFPPIAPDEEEEEFLSDGEGRTALRKPGYVGIRPEDLESGGDGGDRGNATVNGGNGGDRIKIGAYYEEMLKSNPTDALLLRNYGKFLHEVEKDTAGAEEYYGRAILADPGDGELLSLYGTLIWQTQRDEERANSYFDQAIQAAPDDCTVLGSYAHFMWEVEVNGGVMEKTATEMIAAF